MRLIVVGAGKVGAHLARELRRARHAVVLIERDEERARSVSEETEALCLMGDGTDVRLLEQAEAERADWLVAVTGRDEDNLVACQMARVAFGVQNVLARLNDPRNHRTFDALNVPVVSVTDLLAQVITHEVDVEQLIRVSLLGRGSVSLIEAEVPADLPTRLVVELELPAHSVLVSVIRGDEVIVPGPRTEIRGGDRILAVTTVEHEDEVRRAITEKARVDQLWSVEDHTPGTAGEKGTAVTDEEAG